MAVLIAAGVFLSLLATAGLVILTMRRLERVPPTREKLDPTTEALLATIPMPAVVFGESMRRTYVNPAYEASQGLVRRVTRQEWFQRALMESFLTGEATSRPASVEYPEDIYLMPLPGPKVAAIIIDQMERYQTAALREDFIANASHELNTPAAAISLLAEALAKTVKQGSRSEVFAQSLVEEAGRLTSLTRDIVLLSEVQHATHGVDDAAQQHSFEVDEAVREVVAGHAALAEQVGVTLVHTPAGELLRAWDTSQQFEVALGNLVENAIRYAPTHTSVTVEVRRQGECATASVTDLGEGIPTAMQQQVFQRFFRVDPARNRSAGGTGLGLSIARNTARRMGGDVTVISQPGAGATFTFSMPAVPVASTETEQGEHP